MYGYTTSQGTLSEHEQQVREYHQEAMTQQQQQHQMAVAAAAAAGMAAASAGMMKPEGSPESEPNTGPLYPRYLEHPYQSSNNCSVALKIS